MTISNTFFLHFILYLLPLSFPHELLVASISCPTYILTF
jgi:hypothetical protein